MASVKAIGLFLFMIHMAAGLVWPGSLEAEPSLQTAPSPGKRSWRLISVGSRATEQGTEVAIVGSGAVPDYVTTTLLSPPRIVVDISGQSPFFKQKAFPVKGKSLGSVRAGWHPGMVRVVLDITDGAIPEFASKTDGNTLFISLKNRPSAGKEREEVPRPQMSRSSSPEGARTRHRIAETRNDAHPRRNAVRNRTPDSRSVFSGGEPVFQQRSAFGRLLELPPQDNEEDTLLFSKGIRAFKAKEWKEAVESFSAVVARHPDARYSQKAAFLMAKSYDEIHRPAASGHFKEIKSAYENAMSRYPNSPYLAEIYVALGDLCARVENYSEALGYYSLAVRLGKDSTPAQEAAIKKARVLSLKERGDEALAILRSLPEGGSEDLEVRVEFAKVLYETKVYQKSLAILEDLDDVKDRNRYKHPQIALYAGLNHFQLGEYDKARENLYWYYNTSPEKEGSDLILATIGDSYRSEGLSHPASKVYRLLQESHPGREGSLVGLMRLADQQEKGEISSASSAEAGPELAEKPLPGPKGIYEEVVRALAGREHDPLFIHAVIKLAAIHEKEEEFDRSLALLRGLDEKPIPADLRKELKEAQKRVLEGMIDRKMEQEKFSEVAEYYLKEEALFAFLESPKLFMAVGRALTRLHLEGSAVSPFQKADRLLSIKEKPSFLLYALSVDLFGKGRLGEAAEKVRPLLDRKPVDDYTARAHRLTGEILLRQKHHSRALEMFSQGLKQDPSPCLRIELLADRAKALIQAKSKEEALKDLTEAEQYKEGCRGRGIEPFKSLGEAYLDLGRPHEASAHFREALTRATEGEEATAVKFKLARCYESLAREEDSLNVYREIQSGNDVFWSNLARERMEEARFGKNIGDPLKGFH